MHIFALRAGATAAQKNTVRRSYLLRLIVTCAALLLLPFAAGTAAILTRSFNESRDASQAIYRQAAQNFGESYQREISRLYAQAVRLSVESANPGKAASAFKLSLFESSAWYYYEAMKAVNLIDADFPPYAMGVYFYDGDVLITQNGKYTLDSYLKIHGGAPENSERLREFFTGSYAGRGGGMSYCPVLSRDGAYELTFAGADVVFRARRDRALIFYQLAPPTFPMSERIPGADYVAIDGSTGETLFSTREGVAANFSAAMDGAGAEIAVGAGIDSAAAAGAATVAAGAAMDSAGAGASSGVGASSAIGASSGAAAAAGTAAAEATATGAAGTGATVPSASAAAAGAAKPTAPLAAGATAYDAAKATSQLADDGERYAIFTAA
ncbi:MAG: hypothetical protein LBJ10_03750, partial [Clostridiales bacterium]|nr:hypothetical protein [Clostridiales bacterium]